LGGKACLDADRLRLDIAQRAGRLAVLGDAAVAVGRWVGSAGLQLTARWPSGAVIAP
jgi:hypothetical protein